MTRLKDFFKENPKAALGFSGGVDSSYLLYAGKKAGADIRPYYIKTSFQPEFELEDAKRLCQELSIELKVIDVDILQDEKVAVNPENRCYFCKQGIFNTLIKAAASDGYSLILDGSNASDDPTDRPGFKALRELKVKSPLREAGLTKEMIRDLSKEAGLFTWNKPSYSCLATRIPSGLKISEDILKRIEVGEGFLFSLDFKNFRLRYFHGAARIQFDRTDWERACSKREEVKEGLKEYFKEVFYDTSLREKKLND